MTTIARGLAFLLLSMVLAAGCEKSPAPKPKERPMDQDPPKEVGPIPQDKKIPAK
jgi:hypothetical protein